MALVISPLEGEKGFSRVRPLCEVPGNPGRGSPEANPSLAISGPQAKRPRFSKSLSSHKAGDRYGAAQDTKSKEIFKK
jgi:hypothetical protein